MSASRLRCMEYVAAANGVSSLPSLALDHFRNARLLQNRKGQRDLLGGDSLRPRCSALLVATQAAIQTEEQNQG